MMGHGKLAVPSTRPMPSLVHTNQNGIYNGTISMGLSWRASAGIPERIAQLTVLSPYNLAVLGSGGQKSFILVTMISHV